MNKCKVQIGNPKIYKYLVLAAANFKRQIYKNTNYKYKCILDKNTWSWSTERLPAVPHTLNDWRNPDSWVWEYFKSQVVLSWTSLEILCVVFARLYGLFTVRNNIQWFGQLVFGTFFLVLLSIQWIVCCERRNGQPDEYEDSFCLNNAPGSLWSPSQMFPQLTGAAARPHHQQWFACKKM